MTLSPNTLISAQPHLNQEPTDYDTLTIVSQFCEVSDINEVLNNVNMLQIFWNVAVNIMEPCSTFEMALFARIVNYYRKKLHLRCLTWLQKRLY